MSMNPEALQNLLIEMDQQLKQNSTELNKVTIQLETLQRRSLINKATLEEITAETSEDSTVWSGVGKMFLSVKTKDYQNELNTVESSIKEQIKALTIKRDYLKTSVETTAKQMRTIMSGASQ